MAKEEAEYWILQEGFRARGPFPISRLRQWAREGRIDADTHFSLDRRHWESGRSMISVFPREEWARTRTASLRRSLLVIPFARTRIVLLSVLAAVAAAVAAAAWFMPERLASVVGYEAAFRPPGLYVTVGVSVAAAASCAWLAIDLFLRRRRAMPRAAPDVAPTDGSAP